MTVNNLLSACIDKEAGNRALSYLGENKIPEDVGEHLSKCMSCSVHFKAIEQAQEYHKQNPMNVDSLLDKVMSRIRKEN